MTIRVMGYIGALGYIGHRGRSKHRRGKTKKSRRKKKTKRETCKLVGGPLFHKGARVHYNNREDAPTVQLIYEAIRISHEVFPYEEWGRDP